MVRILQSGSRSFHHIYSISAQPNVPDVVIIFLHPSIIICMVRNIYPRNSTYLSYGVLFIIQSIYSIQVCNI